MAADLQSVGNRDSDPQFYQQALLALWAGDFQFAEELLRSHLRNRFPRELSRYADPITDSASRILRQLGRRRREFRDLLSSVGATEKELQFASAVLTAKGNHLRGVVWREDLREFEFRIYLSDLRWERSFYEAISRFSARDGIAQPLYTGKPSTEYPQSQQILGDELLVCDASWTISGSLFMIVRASDFGTVTISAVWTDEAVPETEVKVRQPFQRVLDDLDPGD